VNKNLINKDGFQQYKSILKLTNGQLEGYEPDANITVSGGLKFRDMISKLFLNTRQEGAEAALREWEHY
jgi:hypothetical protein